MRIPAPLRRNPGPPEYQECQANPEHNIPIVSQFGNRNPRKSQNAPTRTPMTTTAIGTAIPKGKSIRGLSPMATTANAEKPVNMG